MQQKDMISVSHWGMFKKPPYYVWMNEIVYINSKVLAVQQPAGLVWYSVDDED